MCWDRRGAGCKEFTSEMKEIVKEYRLTVVVLLEPRISGDTADGVCNKLGKKRLIQSEVAGLSRGVWILLDDVEIILKLEYDDKFILHLVVKVGRRIGMGDCGDVFEPQPNIQKVPLVEA